MESVCHSTRPFIRFKEPGAYTRPCDEKLTARHPQIEGDQAETLDWVDMAHDEDLVIGLLGYRFADRQKRIVVLEPNIPYADLQERLGSAHKRGSS
jgi:hypothetical protein